MTTEDIILEIERIRKIYVEAYPYWTEKGDHAHLSGREAEGRYRGVFDVNEFEYKTWSLIQECITDAVRTGYNLPALWEWGGYQPILESIEHPGQFLIAWERMLEVRKESPSLLYKDGDRMVNVDLFMVELYRTYKDSLHGFSDDCSCEWCTQIGHSDGT